MSDRTLPNALLAAGVSPWLRGLHHDLLDSGDLWYAIRHSGIRGVIADTGTLSDAITSQSGYRDALAGLALRGASSTEAVRALGAAQARWACDELFSTHTTTDGDEGLVSTFIDSPAPHDPAVLVAAAQETATRVNRANVLVRLPASQAGSDALSECTAAGVSTHITGLCSLRQLDDVQHAYLTGLEKAHRARLPLRQVHSVVAMPVGEIAAATGPATEGRGEEVAAAVAALALRHLNSPSSDARWRRLAAASARPLRLMWTGAAAGSVHRYTAPRTICALTPDMLGHVPHRGKLSEGALAGDDAEARTTLDALDASGSPYEDLARRLQIEIAEQQERSVRRLHRTVQSALGTEPENTGR